jgi:hypothetical protein
MHEVCKSGTKGESTISKECTRRDNKEQGTSQAKQQNTLAKKSAS